MALEVEVEVEVQLEVEVPPTPPRPVPQNFFAGVDGGPIGGSSMRRPGSEDPHRHSKICNFISLKNPSSSAEMQTMASLPPQDKQPGKH